jgi:pimeloyl-ACP methyl ester carboxylesterase
MDLAVRRFLGFDYVSVGVGGLAMNFNWQNVPDTAELPPLPLPEGVRSRFVDGVNGLRMHVLEAGFETPQRPCVLLLHGFPELAFSWRRVMPALAQAGWRVLAPDLRGYGRTTGWDRRYDGDLPAFRFLNLLRDVMALLEALGVARTVVVGHDFGSPLAAWCALVRPDVFRAVVLMSAPFGGPPALTPRGGAPSAAALDEALAALKPARKHYQWYYSGRRADSDMRRAPQGIHAFLRAYYHHKSADWEGNQPFEGVDEPRVTFENDGKGWNQPRTYPESRNNTQLI